jgi:hypothetical protein
MQKGDLLKVGTRGLSAVASPVIEGHIVQIYPEIQSGRVIADAEVPDLGNYFVGERTLAWISAGKRTTVAVPADLIFKRYGLDYVRLAEADGETSDVVVQLGHSPAVDQDTSIEVLAGVKPGDRLVRP